jgi:hypothetical protein
MNKIKNKEMLNWVGIRGICDVGGMMKDWLEIQNEIDLYKINHLWSLTWDEQKIPDFLKGNSKLIEFFKMDARNQNGKFYCETVRLANFGSQEALEEPRDDAERVAFATFAGCRNNFNNIPHHCTLGVYLGGFVAVGYFDHNHRNNEQNPNDNDPINSLHKYFSL